MFSKVSKRHVAVKDSASGLADPSKKGGPEGVLQLPGITLLGLFHVTEEFLQ